MKIVFYYYYDKTSVIYRLNIQIYLDILYLFYYVYTFSIYSTLYINRTSEIHLVWMLYKRAVDKRAYRTFNTSIRTLNKFDLKGIDRSSNWSSSIYTDLHIFKREASISLWSFGRKDNEAEVCSVSCFIIKQTNKRTAAIVQKARKRRNQRIIRNLILSSRRLFFF
jgi:hypothetical protein